MVCSIYHISVDRSSNSYEIFELMFTILLLELKTWPTYLFPAAGWRVERCWKNNIGHCRKQCFHVERYKLLCMNKLTCCIPIKEDNGYTKIPPRLIPFEEEITIDANTWELFSDSPASFMNDEFVPEPTKSREGTVTET